MGRLYDLLELKLLKVCSQRWPNKEEIWRLIRKGVNVNCHSKSLLTPLIRLCLWQFDENICQCIRTLLRTSSPYKQVDIINATDREGDNALFLLLRRERLTKSQFKLLHLLLEKGIDVNYRNFAGENVFDVLCMYCESEEHLLRISKLLVQAGYDFHRKNLLDQNALLARGYEMCQRFYLSFLRYFIDDLHVDANSKDNTGSNALLYLCRNAGDGTSGTELIEMASYLIGRGCDVISKDEHGRNALSAICEFCDEESLLELVRLLLRPGVDINCKNQSGQTPLQLVCLYYKDVVDVMELLIENGADIHATDEYGKTVLHVACSRAQLDSVVGIVLLLLRHGIDINCKDLKGNNAMDWLLSKYPTNNLLQVATHLLDNGIDKSVADGNRYLATVCSNHFMRGKLPVDICMLFMNRGIFNVADLLIPYAFCDVICEKYILHLPAFRPAFSVWLLKSFSQGDPDVQQACQHHRIVVSHLCDLCFNLQEHIEYSLNKYGITCTQVHDEEIKVWHEHETHDHLIGFVRSTSASSCDIHVCHPLLFR